MNPKPGLGFRVQGSGFRVKNLGFDAAGSFLEAPRSLSGRLRAARAAGDSRRMAAVLREAVCRFIKLGQQGF